MGQEINAFAMIMVDVKAVGWRRPSRGRLWDEQRLKLRRLVVSVCFESFVVRPTFLPIIPSSSMLNNWTETASDLTAGSPEPSKLKWGGHSY